MTIGECGGVLVLLIRQVGWSPHIKEVEELERVFLDVDFKGFNVFADVWSQGVGFSAEAFRYVDDMA